MGRLLQRDKIRGFAASDAHGGFNITPWLSIRVPSYADTFSFAGMGIGRQYESDPEAAIRKGDFFSCVRGMGEPERFEFFAYRGLQKFPSGSDSPANSNLHVEVQAGKQPSRLVSKKDGGHHTRNCRRSPGPRKRPCRRVSRRCLSGGPPVVASERSVDSLESDFRRRDSWSAPGADFNHDSRSIGEVFGFLEKAGLLLDQRSLTECRACSTLLRSA